MSILKNRNMVGRASHATVELIERRTLMSAGSLDPAFGISGTVTLPHATEVAVDSNGRTILDESLPSRGSHNYIISRRLPDGSVDNTFGTDGEVSASAELELTVFPEVSGKLLLDTVFDGLSQLTESGTPDSSFNSQSSANEIPISAAIQADGKIVASGGGGIYRYNTDGSFDTTFNAGIIPDNFENGQVVIDSAGRTLVSVEEYSSGTIEALGVARLTATGALDTSFGNGGIAIAPASGVAFSGDQIAVAPDGTIYQIADGQIGTGSERPYLYAYSNEGKNVDGGVFGTATGGFTGVVVGQDNKPIVSAYIVNPAGVSQAIVDRFDALDFASSPGLALDSTFNGGTVILGASGAAADSIALDPNGEVEVAVNTTAVESVGSVSRIMTADTSTPLTGTVIGSTGSYGGKGNVAANAFDGNLNTFFDAKQASGDWTGLDLGSAKTISQISFAPRTGWAARMVGGVFQGSNTPNFSSGVQTLYTITTAPTEEQLTTINLAAAGSYRYVRYLGPTNSYCNIAEAQFFAAPAKLTGAIIGTAGSYNNAGNTIANVFDGNLSTFFDAPTPSGAWVGLDLGTATAVSQVSFAPRDSGYSGFAQRMVGGEIQASNTADFSSGVVTAYTITAAPPAGVLTTVTLPAIGAYRYWRYLGPAGGSCNIAELEFDG